MTCFLFPGQGSQKPGMGRDFYESAPDAKAVFDQAETALGSEFLDAVFNGPDNALRDTRVTQPALVTVEVAIAAHLQAHGLRPDTVAGHSIGEISALAVAQALTPETAIAIAVERARLMAGAMTDGAMAAVLGMPPETIEKHLPSGAEVANYNGPEQTIISGTADAVHTAAETLKTAGAKRVLPLNVSGAFHSSFMKPAAERFAAYLSSIEVAAPTCRFVSSVTAREETKPARIRELLAQQLHEPVRWTQVMHFLGPVEAIEVGPGNVLQGLARRTPDAPVVAPVATLEHVDQLLAKHKEKSA